MQLGAVLVVRLHLGKRTKALATAREGQQVQGRQGRVQFFIIFALKVHIEGLYIKRSGGQGYQNDDSEILWGGFFRSPIDL